MVLIVVISLTNARGFCIYSGKITHSEVGTISSAPGDGKLRRSFVNYQTRGDERYGYPTFGIVQTLGLARVAAASP
ncbi:hypothetical protein GCM10027295_06080 [Pseudaeromonas pectinilytica]